MSHIVGKVEYVVEQSFDSMTGLMNRGGFEAQLHESMKALSETDDVHQLIYFDIDNPPGWRTTISSFCKPTAA